MNESGRFLADEGVVEVELLEDQKTGLLVRPGSSDQEMLRDCTGRDYKYINCKDQVILDLGGNIGGFMWRAARDGAKSVVSFEPEPNNFAVLEQNYQRLLTKFPNVELKIVNEAVYDQPGIMELALRTGHYGACTPSLVRHGRKTASSVRVKVRAINQVLELYRPSFIKIDVEGAEYEILRADLPTYVTRMAFEFHGQSPEHREEMWKLWDRLSASWNVVDLHKKKIFGTVQLLTGYLER